MILNKLI